MQSYLRLKLWLGVLGSLTWISAKFLMSLMVRKNYLFLSLIVCKSMHVGRSARLQFLDLLCVNISCLWTFNMPRINGCGLTKVKMSLLKWWLFLVKLLKRSVSSNSSFWNLVNHWQILKAWNNSLIFWSWKTCHVNIGLIPLLGRWLKSCIKLSFNLPKLMCTRSLSTLILIVMKLP